MEAQAALAQEDDVVVVQEMKRRAEAFVAYLGARSAEGKQLGVVLTWTEHRLGELLALMAKSGERAGRGRRSKSVAATDLPPTTHELLGGTPDQAQNLAKRAQSLAKVPVEVLKRIAAEQVARQAEVALAAENDPVVVREMGRRAKALVEYLGARTSEGKQLGVVRTWAQRRLGELLKEMAERGERTKVSGRGRPKKVLDDAEDFPAEDRPPTLKDLGVSYDESSEAQQLAQIPAEEVERIAAEQVETPGAVTPASILAQARRPRVTFPGNVL